MPGLDAGADEILTSDVLLPQQFNDLIHRSAERSPEQNLLAAILEDALKCWFADIAIIGPEHLYQSKRERLRYEADQWIFEKAVPVRFSFEGVCAGLGVDPDYIRGQLLRCEQDGQSRRSRWGRWRQGFGANQPKNITAKYYRPHKRATG
jgi:hypothetical protein